MAAFLGSVWAWWVLVIATNSWTTLCDTMADGPGEWIEDVGNEVVPPSEAELAAEVMQYQTLYKVRERRGTKDKRSSVGDISSSPRETCLPKFQKIRDHSACAIPSDYFTRGGVTERDKALILAFHNHVRGHVMPPAEMIFKLYWSDDLAASAQGYSQECPSDHDNWKKRANPPAHTWVGQNMAMGFRSWKKVLQAWYNEHKHWDYGVGNTAPSQPIGHYVQMVWNKTTQIGCGYSECPSKMYRHYYICNYGPGGDYRKKTPWASGERSMGCAQQFRSRGLCDCGENHCRHGGTMTPSCTCTCKPTYTGRFCETRV